MSHFIFNLKSKIMSRPNLITSEAKLPLHAHGKPIGRQKFLEMVVENFRQRNIYFIFFIKFKCVMNRLNLIKSEAKLPLHAQGKPIGRRKFLKIVLENFCQRNIYFILNFKSKSVMNRPNLITSEAKLPLHAHGSRSGDENF